MSDIPQIISDEIARIVRKKYLLFGRFPIRYSVDYDATDREIDLKIKRSKGRWSTAVKLVFAKGYVYVAYKIPVSGVQPLNTSDWVALEIPYADPKLFEKIIPYIKRALKKDPNGSPFDYINEFKRFALPLIRKSYPKLIADNLVGVQPMSQPSSLIFYLRYRYQKKQYGNNPVATSINSQFTKNLPKSFASPYNTPKKIKKYGQRPPCRR